MLPHVAGRPLTLVRCPTGHGRDCFYQRHPDAGLPPQVLTFPYKLAAHDPDDLLVIDSAEGLVALAQMGVLEIHTWLSHVDAPPRPDLIVFDLDPGPDVLWPQIRASALTVAEKCSALGFEPFLKSTGGRGLHVVLPIEPVWDFVRVRALAKSIVDDIVANSSDTFTNKMAKDARIGRIFLDYLRNAEGASAVAPYSTRNRPGPTCAVPLGWEELTEELDITALTPDSALARARDGMDPWARISHSAVGVAVLQAAENAENRARQ
jgi:bifunctional non-homologous end joining protein LigD